MEFVKEQLLVLFSTPIYMLIIGVELLIGHWRHKKLYSLQDTGTNIAFMLLNALLDLSFRAVYMGIFAALYHYKLITWHNVPLYWLLLLLAEDFLYYWLHRFDHQVRLFWAVHVTHHSSNYFNFTVGFRSSVLQPLYRFVYFLPLPLLGFTPTDILLMYSATQIWGIFVHTELIHKMGILEHILVTPSHHRVHHASNILYLDRNMGMFLIIWDKCFGTFQAELPAQQYEPIKYGLTKPLATTDLANTLTHEWKDIATDLKRTDITWQQKLQYIFGPPGYSHDGSRQTSDELRALTNCNTAETAISNNVKISI
ncbi:MAG TPA: sterol desaturase family protein [Chitinophagaceae bacterium]|nr:sterol desaturase family protein [Chitinophagaceae bacterium]